ncbi:MAG: hypothetical protein JXX14_26520, partial [Deltaproteobacteria bacterium]|nr:hypothetical protein [Deltaproteobacteria bacterium]
ASVESAARFVNDLSTAVGDEKWHYFLSPFLETPVFPQNTVPGAVNGALGIGVLATGVDEAFFEKYKEEWSTEPLDGTYFYYDAAALTMLSLARMFHLEGSYSKDGFNDAIVSVAYRQGIQVKWNQLSQGLQYAASGTEISYSGLSGPLLFDEGGQQQKASVKYWTVQAGKVVDDAQ